MKNKMKNNLTEVRFQFLAGVINENEFNQLSENQLIGNLFNPTEDEDGMIDYEWNDSNVIDVIKNMGYSDSEEIAKEITTTSSPYDFLEMMRNKMGDEDLDITDLTLDMFKQSIKDEFDFK
jgi:hypothetical protein